MGLDRAGKALGRRASPPTEILAKATVLAEGTQGHLRGVALDHFGIGSRYPQAYEIGVKEVWKVAQPLDRIIHTLGWPLRWRREVPARSAARSSTRWAPSTSAIGFVRRARVRRQRAVAARHAAGVQDAQVRCGRCSRAASASRGVRRRSRPAATTRSPSTLACPGAVLTGDSAGLVNIPRLKGVHYAMHSGHPRRGVDPRRAEGRRRPRPGGHAGGYDTAVRKGRSARTCTATATSARRSRAASSRALRSPA